MLALERQKIILEYVNSNKVATTRSLSDLTHASLATLRRDLNHMEQQGLLKKTHGGAQCIDSAAVPAAPSPTSMEPDLYFVFKDQIALKAADFVQSGDIIFVGAGMTCNLLCRYINNSHKEHITVVTTNITAVTELVSNPDISILLLGGNVHAGMNHVETLDEYTVQSLAKLYFDKAFFTVDGIDLNYGYSIINRAQLPLYNHLIENSKSLYLLANEGKFNRRTFTWLCDLDTLPNVITNSAIDRRYLEYYEEHSIKVYTV